MGIGIPVQAGMCARSLCADGALMAWILRRTDQGGGYVARPGSASSYTKNPLKAQRFATEAAAREASCPENETPVDLNRLVENYGE